MFGLFGKKGPSKVIINSGEYEITVQPDENLLAAALKAGVSFPHDCRVGSCGSCTCTLKKGKIKQLTDFSYVLTGDQLKSGKILACQSRLKSDIEIDVEIDENSNVVPTQNYVGKVKEVNHLTHDIVELILEFSDLKHEAMAGQYAELIVSKVGGGRSYSFARAPQNESKNQLSFYIRKVPDGKFTGWLFDEDVIGQEVEVNTPFGQFHYRHKDSPMVCIAGGSGMSAVKAILEQAAIDQVERDAIFLFGARTQNDLYSQKEMDDIKSKWNPKYNFEYSSVLNMEPEDSNWKGPRGMVTDYLKSHYIDDKKLDIKACQGFLCGPPPMIDAAIAVLTNEGMSENEIFYDKFEDSGSSK